MLSLIVLYRVHRVHRVHRVLSLVVLSLYRVHHVLTSSPFLLQILILTIPMSLSLHYLLRFRNVAASSRTAEPPRHVSRLLASPPLFVPYACFVATHFSAACFPADCFPASPHPVHRCSRIFVSSPCLNLEYCKLRLYDAHTRLLATVCTISTEPSVGAPITVPLGIIAPVALTRAPNHEAP